MTKKSTKRNFWSIIGQIAVVITIIWTVIQMFTHFFKKDDYIIKVNGNYSTFMIPEYIKQDLNKYKKTLALYETYREVIGGKIIPMSELLKISEEKLKDPRFKNFYDLNNYHINFKSTDYNELWWFNISNDGNNTIEDLVLEVPFEGYYKFIPQVGAGEYGNFKNRIKLIDLPPGYSIKVFCWRNTFFPSDRYDEEKTRITHKFGVEKIKFPVKVSGLIAWNIKNDNLPLIVLFGIIAILMFIIFSVGVELSPKIKENEKRRKLKEFEDSKKLKEEEKKEKTDTEEDNKSK